MIRCIACALPLLLGCASNSESVPQTPRPVAETVDQLAVLTANSWLYFLDPATGRLTKSIRLDRDQPWGETVWPSQRLAQGLDGKVVALTSWGNVFEVAPSTGAVTKRFEFGRRFTSLAMAPASGRIAVFGSDHPDGIIETRSLGSATPRGTYRIAGSPGMDWTIYGGVWTANESRLYVSYHGSSTTGVDWFTLVDDSLSRCTTRHSPRTGCIDAHGSLRAHRGGLIVATGNPDILVVDSTGHLQRRIETAVSGHLMEFAVDAASEILYAAGPCGTGSGFSAVHLDSGVRTGHHSQYGCAMQIEALGDGLVALTGETGGVVIMDARSGEITAQIPLPGPIIDMLMLRSQSKR